MPECRRKVSPALAFLPVVSCLSPASAFRNQGSVRYRWSRIGPALPSYDIETVGNALEDFIAYLSCNREIKKEYISNSITVLTVFINEKPRPEERMEQRKHGHD
jgi:hypothetical protein